MNPVDHHLEIHGHVGRTRNPGTRVVAGDAQFGVNGGAMHRKLVVALVAGCARDDFALDAGAAVGNEIKHAGGSRIARR